MQDFIDYLLKEFQLPKEVVCNKVDYGFSQKNEIDKKTNIPITHNIISVKIECFDKTHRKLAYISEKFVDGKIWRPKTKKLVNISPDELNNKFGIAKPAICARIQKENADKMKELNELLTDLKTYCTNITVIPEEFINEPKLTPTEPVAQKKVFEF